MTPSVLRRCLLVFAVLGCLLSLSAQDAGSKVLFLGNSITKHGPKADIDWTGNWGMAASAETKDFVHLVTAALAAKSGEAPEVMVKNIADYERSDRFPGRPHCSRNRGERTQIGDTGGCCKIPKQRHQVADRPEG